MKVRDIADKLNLKVYSCEDALDNEVKGGYTSDLLSDVMGHSKEGQVWITLQTHKNIIGVASLRDLSAIILVKGFKPDEDTVKLSVSENIPLLGTEMEAFEISGELYKLV